MLRICREERVVNRYELARKLNFAPQPLNNWEAAKRRRVQVAEMMLNNCTYKQMMHKLAMSYLTLARDVRAVYKAHGIKPMTHRSKPDLARKMGAEFVSPWEDLLKRVKQLRDSGMKWKAIAIELGVSQPRMNSYRQALARRQKDAKTEANADAMRPPLHVQS